MNLFNHLGISMKLKHVIEKNLHIRLNTISFLLGNIKPDISSQYINIPHFKKDAEGFIREEIQSILESKIYEYKSCPARFSERLGIITHYLSDFFCHAHSEYFTKGMKEHYIYEMQLFIHSIIHTKDITRSGYDMNIVTTHNASSICSYIDELHLKYLGVCKEAHPFMDITFTLQACSSLCISIITACMVGEENFSGTVGEVFYDDTVLYVQRH